MHDEWRKSSRSQNTTDCVELRSSLDAVRDSKDPSGPILRVGRIGVEKFVNSVKSGRFDRCTDR